jgi:chromosome segregation ATPase
MQDNNTVQQLSDALTELLNAYDKLKIENTNLQEENANKDNKISELELRNKDLEDQIEQLTDTTEHHTSEIDTMLGRIKTILSDTNEKEAIETTTKESYLVSEEMDISDVIQVTQEEVAAQEQTTMEIDPEVENTKGNSDKEIDLGRMQSLLNGFNN